MWLIELDAMAPTAQSRVSVRKIAAQTCDWLTGVGETLPSPLILHKLSNLIDALGHTPSAAVSLGSFVLLKGTDQTFSVVPLSIDGQRQVANMPALLSHPDIVIQEFGPAMPIPADRLALLKPDVSKSSADIITLAHRRAEKPAALRRAAPIVGPRGTVVRFPTP